MEKEMVTTDDMQITETEDAQNQKRDNDDAKKHEEREELGHSLGADAGW